MIGKSLGESAVYRKCAAPVTVVLAVRDEGGIFVELIVYSLKETVADTVLFYLGQRLAGLVECPAAALCELFYSRVILFGCKHFGLAGGIH